MKFIVDECISRSVFLWLQDNFDTIYVQDVMPAATDKEILYTSLIENRIIVTRDKDFGDMVFRDKNQHAGIILLRLSSNHPTYQLIVLQKVLHEYHRELIGSFIVASESSVKIIKGILH